MKAWYDIYKERMNKKYRQHIQFRYKPFIREIVKAVEKLDTTAPWIYELGCGAANISASVHLLSERVYIGHVLVDICPRMLSLAMENMRQVQAAAMYAQKSILDLPVYWPKPDLVHSHGVLEHFTDEEIISIVERHKGVPQYHYVPGAKYKTPSRGDERLMTEEQWRNIYPFKKIKTFNNGYDFILVA